MVIFTFLKEEEEEPFVVLINLTNARLLFFFFCSFIRMLKLCERDLVGHPKSNEYMISN